MISSRMAVAVHVLTYLAFRRGEPCTSECIAGSVNTNPVVVRRIVGALRQAGLVRAQPGAGGGATLAREPEQITLLQVYRAVEPGGALFGLHANPPSGACRVGGNIQGVLAGVFCQAREALEGVLAATTVAQVQAGVAACAARCREARVEAHAG